MSAPTSPADLYRHSLRLLLDKDIARLGGPVGRGRRHGVPLRPSGLAHSGWRARRPSPPTCATTPTTSTCTTSPDLRIHQTTDPETIVVEMRGVGRLVETDAPFDMTYIAVVTVRDGRITSYRDYWNPLAVLEPGTDFTGSSR